MKTSNFQIGIMVVFIVFLIVGVLIFAEVIPVNKNKSDVVGAEGMVVIWGTIPNSDLNQSIQDYNYASSPLQVYYRQKSVLTFEEDLIEALASGLGPDVFILSNDMITKFSNKIYPIQYSSFPARSFQDTFISGADIYMSNQGILGMPIAVDPLILYFNIDSFNSASISRAPLTWDDFRNNSKLLTNKDSGLPFRQSGSALGTFDNIANAKEILYSMLMQSGSSLIVKDQTGLLYSDLGEDKDFKMLEFYLKFGDSSKSEYSWNNSFNSSLNMFITSNLAQYIGFASELPKIQALNPNLKFDIAKLPQLQNGKNLTYGKTYALAISKTTRNLPGATRAVLGLSSKEFNKTISDSMKIPSARKDLLTAEPKSSFDPVLNASAFISRSIIEPGSKQMDNVLRGIINGIRSGNINLDEALGSLGSQVNYLLQNKKI